MTKRPPNLAPQEKILAAFVHHYTPPQPGGVAMDKEQLIMLLQKLPSLSRTDNVDTIMVQIGLHEPGLSLAREDQALISFVDEAFTELLNETDLDFKIESFIRGLAPRVAAIALGSSINEIIKPQSVYSLLDLLIKQCIGWSEDLGFLGHQFMEKVSTAISGLVSARLTIEECIEELRKHFKKETPLFNKMEKQLADRQLKVIAETKGQYFSAEVINKEMSGQQLPLFIIFMLQGPWYDFLKNIFIQYGQDSKEWQNATKMTEALVWSLQPRDDLKKQESVMHSLPDHIRKLCENASFETEQLLESLADVAAEYDAIRKEDPSDPCDFDLIETDESMGTETASAAVVEEIESIKTDQWFLYDDANEPEEKVARIKLILNWTDTQQLLLTNHNRRKVIQMSYMDMLNHLATGVLRKLNPRQSAASAIKSHLRMVLNSVSTQNKKEKRIEEPEARREESNQYSQQRKDDIAQLLQHLQERAEVKKQRANLLRNKAKKKQEAAEATVNSLKQEAWVSLPVMEGTLTPCKLVAIIPANHTYIFTNRAGIKVAEYTASQLAHMIVAENSEILDTGAEFESALATVVSGLRDNKNKTYEELSGDTG